MSDWITFDSSSHDIEIRVRERQKKPEIPTNRTKIIHWGDVTKSDQYPLEDAYQDLKDAGVEGNLCHVGNLVDSMHVHNRVFGEFPTGVLASGPNEWWEKSKALENDDFVAALSMADIVTLNSESKHGHLHNGPLREMLEKAIVEHNQVAPNQMWTHDQVVYREQCDPGRWDACNRASDWWFTYPWNNSPQMRTAAAALCRGTGLPVGYLVVEMPDYFDHFKLAPRDCIIRGMQLAALARPWAVGVYGWWRLWNVPGAKETLVRACEEAKKIIDLTAGWERVPSDVLITYDREGWYYKDTKALHGICAALSRRGVRYDIAAEDWMPMQWPQTPVQTYKKIIDFHDFKYNKYMTYGDPKRLDSPIHWRQDEAEAEADRSVDEFLQHTDLPTEHGSYESADGQQSITEVFKRGDSRRRITVNATMAYEANKPLPQAGYTWATNPWGGDECLVDVDDYTTGRIT